VQDCIWGIWLCAIFFFVWFVNHTNLGEYELLLLCDYRGKALLVFSGLVFPRLQGSAKSQEWRYIHDTYLMFQYFDQHFSKHFDVPIFCWYSVDRCINVTVQCKRWQGVPWSSRGRPSTTCSTVECGKDFCGLVFRCLLHAALYNLLIFLIC
jgi:hypothetical protein